MAADSEMFGKEKISRILLRMAPPVMLAQLIQAPMLRVFTKDPEAVSIGAYGFHLIGISFLPMVTSLIFPVFFQALGQALKSSLLTIIRTVV